MSTPRGTRPGTAARFGHLVVRAPRRPGQRSPTRWATTPARTSRSSSRWPTHSPSATITTVRCWARPSRTGCTGGPTRSTRTTRTAARSPIWSSQRRAVHLDDLCRTTRGCRRELEGLPLRQRHRRPRHAATVQKLPRRLPGVNPLYDRSVAICCRAVRVRQAADRVVAVPRPRGWRRRTFGDLTRTLRFGAQAAAPVIPDTGGNLHLATYQEPSCPAPALPAATLTVPHQERGHRRHGCSSPRLVGRPASSTPAGDQDRSRAGRPARSTDDRCRAVQ